MLCIACASPIRRLRHDALCGACRAALEPGPSFVFDGGVFVTSGYAHRGAARRLVHRLKYGGFLAAGEVLATQMARRLPAGATCLVPVPRAYARRIRHGVDPAVTLARMVGAQSGLPVVPALRAAVWWPRHATRSPRDRRPARFRAVRTVGRGAVLVDDVVTTGSTLRAAQDVLAGVHLALAATAPLGNLRQPAERPMFATEATGRVIQRDEQDDPPDQEGLCQETR